jgi:hypothetical protein
MGIGILPPCVAMLILLIHKGAVPGTPRLSVKIIMASNPYGIVGYEL